MQNILKIETPPHEKDKKKTCLLASLANGHQVLCERLLSRWLALITNKGTYLNLPLKTSAQLRMMQVGFSASGMRWGSVILADSQDMSPSTDRWRGVTHHHHVILTFVTSPSDHNKCVSSAQGSLCCCMPLVMDSSPFQIMGVLSLFLCFGFVTAGTYTSHNSFQLTEIALYDSCKHQY